VRPADDSFGGHGGASMISPQTDVSSPG